MSAERIFPAMEVSRMFLRPYFSERAPISGEMRNWSVLAEFRVRTRCVLPRNVTTYEKAEPINPPV